MSTKKLFLTALAVLFPILANADASGQCGNNLMWNFETATNTLTISGTGNMYFYKYENRAPWYDYRYEIFSVLIVDSVTSIGNWAFAECDSLTSITIPNSVRSIGESAFQECTSLTSITIPNSVRSIGAYAFNYCTSLTSITIPNSVTSIGSWAFAECDSLTSITIPNSVRSIEGSTFDGCGGLTSITIPNSVTSIGTNAFSCCSSLASITIPNNLKSIEEGVFWGCTSLTSITIPNSVRSIGNNAFSCCSSLASITIPNSVTSIGHGAFGGCSSLASITIPNSVTSIGYGAFSGCSSLASITIPNNVKSIESSTFSGCAGLTSITIPNNVKSIKEGAFWGCTSLTSITIPNSVTSIKNGVFGECTGLTSMKVESGNDVYDSRNDCNAIIKTETNELISGCKNTIIPNSITSIEANAFNRCSGLTSITIPNSVTSIRVRAFYGCDNLEEVVMMIKTPFDIDESVFSTWNSETSDSEFIKATLSVPKGTAELYRVAQGWKEFVNIIERDIDPDNKGGVDFGEDSKINDETNLDDNIIGNIYFNIADDAGSYSSTEGCITVVKPTSDEQVKQLEGQDLFSEEFRNQFTGIVFKVEAGKGAIKVKAETKGNMVLKVKVGINEPVETELDGQQNVTFPYNVSKPTNIYIYAGTSTNVKAQYGTVADGPDELKIYSIEWSAYEDGIEQVDNEQLKIDNVIYNLSGQRLSMPQRGVNIIGGKKVVVN